MSSKYSLEAYGLTDVGLKRTNNEDSYSVQTSIGFFIVADGLGGYEGGEIASSMLVDSMVETLYAQTFIKPLIDVVNDAVPVEMIHIPAKMANSLILNTSILYPQYHGMATTFVSLLFYNKKVLIANVGDSRAYCLRDKTLKQLSVDHVVIQENKKRYLAKAIGVNKEVTIEMQSLDIKSGDIFIICSDGITDLVDDKAIESIVNTSANVKLAVRSLIAKAKSNGGNDNITVVVVKVT